MIGGKELDDKIALDIKLAKYQKSLEKEVERQKLFQKKYPHYKVQHVMREEATQEALDTFKSIVGVKL